MAFDSSRGNVSALADYSTLAESEESLTPETQDSEDETEDEAHEPESDEAVHERLVSWIDNPNIARDIDQDTLRELGQLVCREYEIDELSRKKWLDQARTAMKFCLQEGEPKQYPWEDASNVIFPLITSASMRFGAISYPAIVPSRNVVKGVIWGDDNGTPVTTNGKPDGAPKLDANKNPIWLIPPGQKKIRSERVGEHMSWQLLDQMDYWEEQTDTLLHQIPIVGGAVRKSYRDMREDCNASELVSLVNLCWNMGAKSFDSAPRHTEIQEFYPFEIQEMERDDEMFLPKIYGPGDVQPDSMDRPDKPAPDPNDTQAAHTFLEQHRRYDLDGDGYPEPITVTVHRRSQEVVRIVARFEEAGIKCVKETKKIKRIVPCDSYTLYRFLPNPEGGSYPCGFGHYIKPLNEAINTTLNQMFDAEHLRIAGGGFIAAGMSIHSGTNNFSIGEYKPVNTKGNSIRDSVFPIPWPGANEVLFQLLGLLIQAGKEVASVQDVLTGDASMANTPPTTMIALVEQGMRVYTAIYKRVYRAVKSELKKLWRLNKAYLVEDERYQVGDTWRVVSPDDYRLGGGVEPVADPTMVTDMQRLTRAALIIDRADKNPMVNKLNAEKYLFEAAQIPRVSDFLPDQAPPPQPTPEQIKAQAAQLQAQTDASRAQFEVAEAQSKLGLTRAQELQAYTQALVNFANSKSKMSDAQVTWMETQLDAMRLHIEALNTTVKAAAVDAKMHGDRLSHQATMTGHAVTHHANLADTVSRARELANEQPQPGSTDDSGGGASPPQLSQPPGPGTLGNGIPAMAPQPDNTSVAPVPGPSLGQPGP